MSSESPTPEKEEAISRVQSLLGSILGQLPGQSSPIPKLTRDQVDRLFEIAKESGLREERRKRLVIWLTFILGMTALCGICFLCWLFLYFGQQEYIDKIITALLAGLAGSGFSLGLLFGGRKNT
jgi:hypothetical protein